ncbi:hypothetical protein L6250_01490 [Candidatus Parcubacteria bacterium]|nr:hypothetical protein [Candidatus Omnitrophota bacterium]MCG2688288.1 hypothetical protein [Candidatus Parcubacteria bacterium]
MLKKSKTILRFLRGRQSGFALPLVILIAVILIVVGGAGYYFYKKVPVDETADWKTYRDEQNEWYEVKYSPNWTVRSSTVGIGSMVTFYNSGISVFKVWSAPNWDGFLSEEWWDEKDRQDEMNYIKKDSIKIDGVSSLVFQAIAEPKEEHFVFTGRSGIYDISAVADRKIIKQILSTFKFIGKESEAVQSTKEEIIEIIGKVNAIDNRMIELVSKDGTGYVLRTHPVLVFVFDLSHIQKEDYLESIKGVRDIMVERRVNLWGISKVLVRTAQFPARTKLVIEPMIDPADMAENFIDEFLKLIGKTPYLEFRLEEKATGLTGKHLMRAQLDFDPKTNKPVINLKFNKEGKQIFLELVIKNTGKELVIYLDGAPICSFVIQNSIFPSSLIPTITGDFTIDEAKQLVRWINAGALPVPMTLVSHQNKVDVEDLRALHEKTISVKGYLLGEKLIDIISFEAK